MKIHAAVGMEDKRMVSKPIASRLRGNTYVGSIPTSSAMFTLLKASANFAGFMAWSWDGVHDILDDMLQEYYRL